MAVKVTEIKTLNEWRYNMGAAIFQVDAFTSRPFAGNPAAVCLLEDKQTDAWMQSLGAEMNLSETAIVARREENNAFDLRWFTPSVEVDLCGHATLAAAHVLWEEELVSADQSISFHTRSGLLTAKKQHGLIELDFPVDPVIEVTPPQGLEAAIGLNAVYVGKGRDDYLIEVETEQQLRELAPDFRRLATIPGRGFIVTAPAEGEFDFVSRFFAPRVGIDEDPVTGSAHCTLAHYWERRLGKQSFNAVQLSKRGGTLKVTLKNDRVTLSGKAVLISKGNLYV
jgi:PhzF family phenazine biosynthesis protein